MWFSSPVSHFPKKKLEQNLQFNRTFWRVCTIPLSVFVLLTFSTIFLWQEVGQLWRMNRICFFKNLQKARDGKWDGKEFICRRCQSQPDKSSLLGHSGGWHNPWPNVCRHCWGLSDKEPNKNEPVPVKSTCQPIKARWENDIQLWDKINVPIVWDYTQKKMVWCEDSQTCFKSSNPDSWEKTGF